MGDLFVQIVHGLDFQYLSDPHLTPSRQFLLDSSHTDCMLGTGLQIRR